MKTLKVLETCKVCCQNFGYENLKIAGSGLLELLYHIAVGIFLFVSLRSSVSCHYTKSILKFYKRCVMKMIIF